MDDFSNHKVKKKKWLKAQRSKTICFDTIGDSQDNTNLDRAKITEFLKKDIVQMKDMAQKACRIQKHSSNNLDGIQEQF